MTGSLLEVRDLSVAFPARHGGGEVLAVDKVSLDVARGETLGLVGESGSGKTTTCRAILQLQAASSGSVRLLGRDLTRLPSAELRRMRRHMQFVLQNPYSSLNPRFTVARSLIEPLRVHRSVPANQRAERVRELLEMVGLPAEVSSRYPHEFSGGQRQRIVIARALAVYPELVVCDEPVSALDVRTQAQIVALMHDLQQRLGLSYLFIAHDLAIVRQVADRIAVMYGGRIVESGSVAQVYDAPAHPYTQALLDAVPVLDPGTQRRRLRQPAASLPSRNSGPPSGPCPFGAVHSETGTPEWHEIGGGHGVSCRYWMTR